MVNYYRINVSQNGTYLFATEQARLTTKEEAETIYKLFQEKFPENEGYKIHCTYWRGSGTEVVF